MQILKYPHPVLKMKCVSLKRVDAELLGWIDEMFEIMYETKGVGLAANQVGLPYRFFIINPTGDAEKKDKERVFINPIVTLGAGKPILEDEGCLSYPKMYYEVLRSPKVTIRAYDLKGNEINEQIADYSAKIVQHEYDHLEGIGFVQRLDPESLRMAQRDMRELEEEFARQQASGDIPTDEEIANQIADLLAART